MNSRIIRSIRIAAVILTIAAANLYAQVQSRLEGQVRDPSGAAILGAKVTVSDLGTGVVNTATTNESGAYAFNSLRPATYEIRCELAGFKTTVRNGVAMETGLTKTVDIQLELGSLTETVEVKDTVPLLDTGTATGQFIERTTILKMPIDSRRTGSLARLVGGVAFTNEAGGLSTPQFSVAGGRSENQMWMTDGASSQAIALGSPATPYNPPAEAVQEMKVETNSYGAEFGRAGGGLIIVTTRSGTNAFHGALYEFLRNDKLNSRTFFAPGKAPLRFNTFGFAAGGPIIKNKTFFFANYEVDRRRTGSTSSSTVPHSQEIGGDFSSRTDVAIKDPLTANPFAGNIIPASRIDPISRAYAAFYPAPLQATDPSRAPTVNFIKNVSDALDRGYLTARVDHTFNERDRAFVRVVHAVLTNDFDPVFPDPIVDPRAEVSHNDGDSILGVWNHTFTPTLLHEARFLYDARASDGTYSGAGSGLNGKLGLQGVDPTFSATITMTGLTGVGSSNQKDTGSPLTKQFIDSLTWIRGNHEFKTGMEYRYSRLGVGSWRQAGGSFSFTDRATGSGLATMLLGWTSSAQFIALDPIRARSDYFGAYVQDTWKIQPRLTLSLGLRWEMDTPRWDENNRQSSFDSKAINPVSGTPGIVTFAGVDGVSKYANNFDKNNFAPTVALVWRPSDGIVVRTGYGIHYYGQYADNVGSLSSAGFGSNGSFTSPDGGFTPAFLFRDGMPVVVREEQNPAFGAVPLGTSPRFSPDFFANDHSSAYSQQWNFTIQKELGGNFLLETAYLGNVGHKLGGQRISINQIPLVNGKGPAQQSQLLRPFPQFNAVTLNWPSWGNSTYHALNARLEKRYANGLNLLMNYTWSKFLDDVKASAEIGPNTGSGYTHIERRQLDKSYSGSHIPHNFSVSSVYDLPFGHDRHFQIANPILEQMFGGWTSGVMLSMRSGAPYGVVEQTNASNTFSDGVRPYITGNPEITADRTRGEMVAKYFDTSVFRAPAAGEFGDAARMVGLGPGLMQLDVSVQKVFALTERFKLQFRSEFINLPNRPNFVSPNVQRGNPNFGRILATRGTGRVVQFGLRLEW